MRGVGRNQALGCVRVVEISFEGDGIVTGFLDDRYETIPVSRRGAPLKEQADVPAVTVHVEIQIDLPIALRQEEERATNDMSCASAQIVPAKHVGTIVG